MTSDILRDACRLVAARLRRSAARLRDCEKGNAAVEFGLVVPIMAILVAGVLDYGAMINNMLNLEASTRGAVEYYKANTSATNATVTSFGNFPAGATVTASLVCTCVNNSSVSCSGGTCSGSDTRVIEYAQVSATMNYSAAVPYMTLLLPSTLTATSALRVQ